MAAGVRLCIRGVHAASHAGRAARAGDAEPGRRRQAGRNALADLPRPESGRRQGPDALAPVAERIVGTRTGRSVARRIRRILGPSRRPACLAIPSALLASGSVSVVGWDKAADLKRTRRPPAHHRELCLQTDCRGRLCKGAALWWAGARKASLVPPYVGLKTAHTG